MVGQINGRISAYVLLVSSMLKGRLFKWSNDLNTIQLTTLHCLQKKMCFTYIKPHSHLKFDMNAGFITVIINFKFH